MTATTRRAGRLAGLAVALFVAFSPATALAQYFGAIAYSAYSGRWGYSYDYLSRYEAEQRALAECGGGCQIAVWFSNGCGALAVGPDGWGSGWAYSRAQAEANALSACRSYSYGCRIQAWACTTR
ncbi:MAG: hypothetical protein BroJett030_23910 [Alphaproteobacteria bacterium]|nr:MAG: hypothetical protein BroJett030_23910 [Alphaproteobacteria bacterium]